MPTPEEILLGYGLIATLVVAPLTAIFGQILFTIIAVVSGIFATAMSFAFPLFFSV